MMPSDPCEHGSRPGSAARFDGAAAPSQLTEQERVERGVRIARELIALARIRGVEQAEAAIEAEAERRNPYRSMRVYDLDSIVAPPSAHLRPPDPSSPR